MNQEPTRNEQPTREYPAIGQQQRPVVKPSRFGAVRKSTVAVGLAAIFVVAAGAVAMSQTGKSYPTSRPVVLAGQEMATTTEAAEVNEPATQAAVPAPVTPKANSVPATCAARDARERAEDLAKAREDLRKTQETPAQEAARERAEDLTKAQEKLREARETPAQEAARERAEDLQKAREDAREAQENILCGEYQG
ncbi:MAG TPA: hypothetical protein VG276_28580 [Actinomycetes bacterium]|jgi:succinate dehydrogenase/fumarate reductase flavoprotein subunit|nr:hypothetical protein [Actinomycetes bacterium]